VVTGEDDESITLLHNRILEEDVYQQQQGMHLINSFLMILILFGFVYARNADRLE
jgi:hypothetical protein